MVDRYLIKTDFEGNILNSVRLAASSDWTFFTKII